MRKQGRTVGGGIMVALVGLVSAGLAGAPQIENFNLPDGSLPAGWVVVSGQWKILDRQLDGHAFGAASGHSTDARIDKTNVNFSNGTIMFKVRPAGLSTREPVSHLFRVQDDQNRYSVSLQAGGRFGLRKTVNGQVVSLAADVVTNNPFVDWQAVKIDATDTRIRVFVNDVLIFDVADTRTSQGRIAFFIPDGEEGDTNWRFDHVSIRQD